MMFTCEDLEYRCCELYDDENGCHCFDEEGDTMSKAFYTRCLFCPFTGSRSAVIAHNAVRHWGSSQ